MYYIIATKSYHRNPSIFLDKFLSNFPPLRVYLQFFLSLYGHKLPVLCMDISSDSTLLVTGSADRNVKIWGLDFGDCHKSIFAHDDRYEFGCTSVSFVFNILNAPCFFLSLLVVISLGKLVILSVPLQNSKLTVASAVILLFYIYFCCLYISIY